jgi:hypothetical protein
MSITYYPQLGQSPSTAVNVAIGGTNLDAFGRLRISNPFTLFDSSHRYTDNGSFVSSTSGTASATFNADQGLIDLAVGTASGDLIRRETKRVFPYQPGKSILVMTTFVMAPAKTNLTQRVGYYGANNGFYLEQEGSDVYLVRRSSVTGSVVNTRISKSSWNQDKLDGTGKSGITLDLTKAQILFFDLEWLGVGTVRAGFIIDGAFVPCHYFQHANTTFTSTYITTASLPLRYEIENTGVVASASTLKQICSTVISEGGYELAGTQQAIGTAITSPKTLTTAGTEYPIISLRLKSARLDAVAILSAVSILGITNNANYKWAIFSGGTTTAGTWVSAGANSAVEYNITGTSFAGGSTVASGYFQGSNQGSSTIDISKSALFKFQLERNTFTSTPHEMTLVCSSASNGDQIHASIDWEEVVR